MRQYEQYYMPESLEALFCLIENNRSDFDIVAGGTDLYALEKDAFSTTKCAIDISCIRDFSEVSVHDGSISFGSCLPIQRFLDDEALITHVPLMRHAAACFADQQIRQMATVGGNLSNASPCGDAIPVLLAMDAMLHAVSVKDSVIQMRDMPVGHFIQGAGKTQLQDGEILHSVTCPILEGYGCAFKKVGLRRSLCISVVNAAFLVKTDDDRPVFEDVRIAFGGIGPTPVRFKAVEDALIGRPVSQDIIQRALTYIPDDAVRSRSRRQYRQMVIRNFLLAGLFEALAEVNILPA